ncbi:MAG: SDR family oxidoreductase, partial [Lachnospiraceae bacterium]|nr:SDR family oxidoreductase [Lachnospiraceae bacterium]
LTKALAKELAPSGIQVNAIAFGAIDTEMNSFLSDNEKKVLEEEIPFGRMATPQEAASFVYQLAHSEPYLTGQIISFNGGWY